MFFLLDLSSPPATPECPVVFCLISCRQYKIDVTNGCLLCICEENSPSCNACDCPINIAGPIKRDGVTGCPKCSCNSPTLLPAHPPLPALVPLPSPTPLPAPTPHPPLQPHPPPPTSCEVNEHFYQLFFLFHILLNFSLCYIYFLNLTEFADVTQIFCMMLLSVSCLHTWHGMQNKGRTLHLPSRQHKLSVSTSC